jgi:hypothetical protein
MPLASSLGIIGLVNMLLQKVVKDKAQPQMFRHEREKTSE